MTYRPLVLTDLPEIARLHCNAFAESMLTVLGRETARRYYGERIVASERCLSVGAFFEGQCIGFCCCGHSHGAMAKFLRHQRRYLIGYLLTHPWLFCHPVVRDRLFKIPRRLFKQVAEPENTKTAQQPCIISPIAVAAEWQQRGIGRQLMEQSERWATLHNFETMQLIVAMDNKNAIGFYERLGWTRIYEKNGEWQGMMIKSLKPVSPETVP